MKTQYYNTYKIECRYSEYPDEVEAHYYCDDEPSNTPPSMKLLRMMYEDYSAGELIIEIVDEVQNNFGRDNYLSDELIDLLNGCPSVNLLPKEQREEQRQYMLSKQRLYLQYLGFVSFEYKGEEEAYKRGLIESLIKNIKCHSYKINKELLNDILSYVGEKVNTEVGSVKHQLHLLFDEKKVKERKYEILCELTTVEETSRLREILRKMDKMYHLKTEEQQKVAAIMLLFMTKYRKHLLEKVAGNFERVKKLLSEYYGIDTPTYRQGDLYFEDSDWDKYIKNKRVPQAEHTYKNRIEMADSSFWNSL